MPLPLLAAGLDWLEGLLPLLFLLFWIISQIRGLFRGAAQAGKPQRPVVIAKPRPAPEVPEGGNERIAREIEEFLRERMRGGTEPRRSGPRPPKRAPRPAAAVPPPAAAGPPRSAAAGAALGKLKAADNDVARHVQEAFAHGKVPVVASATAAPRPAAANTTPAATFAALVRDPATLRQLFVVREVLERPVDRW